MVEVNAPSSATESCLAGALGVGIQRAISDYPALIQISDSGCELNLQNTEIPGNNISRSFFNNHSKPQNDQCTTTNSVGCRIGIKCVGWEILVNIYDSYISSVYAERGLGIGSSTLVHEVVVEIYLHLVYCVVD